MGEPEILTVGHSTHEADRFLKLLGSGGVEALADVRRYPGSRRHPQFNAGVLGSALNREGIAYEPLGDQLGGRRRARRESPNAAWQVEGFRGYADHMVTPEFAAGIERLEELARARRTAFMCAEGDWHRCHRRLIADALFVRGWRVLHLLPDGLLEQHALPDFAVVEGTSLSYPGQPSLGL